MSDQLVSAGLRELVKRLVEGGYIATQGFLGGEYGYGVEYDSDEFMMHPYCWCEKDDCPWCGPDLEWQQAPNFHHKESGFKVWWYKYINRGMRVENPNNADFVEILAKCVASISPKVTNE